MLPSAAAGCRFRVLWFVGRPELVDTRFTSTGVAVHTYRPAGLPRHGAFAISAGGSTTSGVTTT